MSGPAEPPTPLTLDETVAVMAAVEAYMVALERPPALLSELPALLEQLALSIRRLQAVIEPAGESLMVQEWSTEGCGGR